MIPPSIGALEVSSHICMHRLSRSQRLLDLNSPRLTGKDLQAMDIDTSVLTALPDEVRADVERQIALARRSLRGFKYDGDAKYREQAHTDEEVAANVSSGSVQAKRKKTQPKYRQARESNDTVEVLCFKCRREPGSQAQAALTKFFGGCATDANRTQCSRCRLPLTGVRKKSATMRALPSMPPQSSRLKAYKRLAEHARVPFALTDGECLAIMRQPCYFCGAEAGESGNGISRLRNWVGFEALKAEALKGFQGPFSKANVVAACATCNLMRGYRSIASFVEAARTIASHRTKSDFGQYPERFRNNVSKRSRSSYITQSSTHTKTHALTNQQFAEIVSGPCHYCGKVADPPRHYNGLDRLDSENRIYSAENVVSCCGTIYRKPDPITQPAGDCNIMKYKHSERFFINHCVKVAQYHRCVVFSHEEDDEEEQQSAESSDLKTIHDDDPSCDLPYRRKFEEGVPETPTARCPERPPE